MHRTCRNFKTTYANGMSDRTKDYGPAAMYVKLSLRRKSDTFLCQNLYQSFQSVSRASLSGVVLPTAMFEAHGVIHRVRMFRGLYGTALFFPPTKAWVPLRGCLGLRLSHSHCIISKVLRVMAGAVGGPDRENTSLRYLPGDGRSSFVVDGLGRWIQVLTGRSG